MCVFYCQFLFSRQGPETPAAVMLEWSLTGQEVSLVCLLRLNEGLGEGQSKVEEFLVVL
jgi:hypothetical protein